MQKKKKKKKNKQEHLIFTTLTAQNIQVVAI